MKTSELALILAAITLAPHLSNPMALGFTTFLIALAAFSVWAERKQANGKDKTQ